MHGALLVRPPVAHEADGWWGRYRCAGTPTGAAIERAHDQFRWFAGGWVVNADLPTPGGFAGATQFVRREDVAKSIPCGPDLDAIVDAVRPYWEAGFTDVALVQIGGDAQELFFKEAAEPLLTALRTASNCSTFGSVLPGYTGAQLARRVSSNMRPGPGESAACKAVVR